MAGQIWLALYTRMGSDVGFLHLCILFPWDNDLLGLKYDKSVIIFLPFSHCSFSSFISSVIHHMIRANNYPNNKNFLTLDFLYTMYVSLPISSIRFYICGCKSTVWWPKAAFSCHKSEQIFVWPIQQMFYLFVCLLTWFVC